MILYAGVDLQVHFEIAGSAEEFRAALASKRLLFGVSTYVEVQIGDLRELLLANVTFESLVLRMRPQMKLHVTFVVKDLSTLEALLGLRKSGQFLLPLLLEDLNFRGVFSLHLLFVVFQQIVEVRPALDCFWFAFSFFHKFPWRFFRVQNYVHVQQIAGFNVGFNVGRCENHRLKTEIWFLAFVSKEFLHSCLYLSLVDILVILIRNVVSQEVLQLQVGVFALLLKSEGDVELVTTLAADGRRRVHLVVNLKVDFIIKRLH